MTSAASVAGAPSDPGPRIALVGRSNVGKSSLINALAGRPIARTSATPGRTRLANFYRVAFDAPGHPGTGGRRSTVYLVDLPGYGYARAPRQARGAPSSSSSRGGGRDDARVAFARLADGLFAGGIAAALLVVDARHPRLESDRDARDGLADRGVAYGVVATKVDKLSRAEGARAVQRIAETLEGPALAFSAATGEGRDDLWRMIAELARAQAGRPARE